MREVQQTVIVTGRIAQHHSLQHRFDRMWRPGIGNEIRPSLAAADIPEGHVVPTDLDLHAVFDQLREGVVRIGRLDRIVQLDVVQLGAADDRFLRLSWAA